MHYDYDIQTHVIVSWDHFFTTWCILSLHVFYNFVLKSFITYKYNKMAYYIFIIIDVVRSLSLVLSSRSDYNLGNVKNPHAFQKLHNFGEKIDFS